MSAFVQLSQQQQRILELLQALKNDTSIIREGNAAILREVRNGVKEKDLVTLVTAVQTIATNLTLDSGALTQLLNKILTAVTPNPAVKCYAVITINPTLATDLQGEFMEASRVVRAASATADLQVNEVTGSFTVNLKFQDLDDAIVPTPAGLQATYAASDAAPGPSITNLVPSADTSSCAGTVNQTVAKALNDAGTALPTGLTISGTATWPGLATPVNFTAAPALDFVPGPAGQVVAAVSEP